MDRTHFTRKFSSTNIELFFLQKQFFVEKPFLFFFFDFTFMFVIIFFVFLYFAVVVKVKFDLVTQTKTETNLIEKKNFQSNLIGMKQNGKN